MKTSETPPFLVAVPPVIHDRRAMLRRLGLDYRRPSSSYSAAQALQLALTYFDPGSQARSLRRIWRMQVGPRMGICYRTFLRYLQRSGFDSRTGLVRGRRLRPDEIEL